MNHSLSFVVVAAAALVTAVTATGCAAAPAPEAKGRSHANEEIDTGGGEAGDPNTIFMKVDQSSVFYDNSNDNAIQVAVCESNADPAIISQIKGLAGQPRLVLQKADGSYDTRLASPALRQENVYYCPGGKYGGAAYTFQLWQQDASFFTHDLSGAFVSGFAGKNFECDVGFQLSRGLDIDVSGFRVENGTLHRPDVTLRFEGDSQGAAKVHCQLSGSSGVQVFAAGPVPVFYELEIAVGLTVALGKASHVSATIGTTGGSLTTDDPEITITPEIELGVNFYGVVGASVGIGFPVTVSPHPPCTPDVTLGAEIKVGAEVGLIGFKEFPIQKALSVEVSTPVLGPWQIASSQCN